MRKPTFVFCMFMALFIGFVIGLVTEDCPKPKEISYTQLEKDLDKAYCEAKVIQAIISERVRLTGKVNP